MDYLFQDGGKPKKTKSKTKTSTKTGTKTKTKTGTKTTKSKSSTKNGTKSKTSTKSSSKKGGNFLGAVGDLVAPTGWGPFATAAGLLALDRADAALRRGKSEKSSAKKGGMRGGNEADDEARIILETTNQAIINIYDTNLQRSYHEGKNQGVHSQVLTDLNEKIEKREKLLHLVSDRNIKKKLESSIKRLYLRMFQEGRRNLRRHTTSLRSINTPNTPLNWS